MERIVQAASAATIVAAVAVLAVAALAVIVVARRRRFRHTRVTTSRRIADLRTSYDSLKEATAAMAAGEYATAMMIGERVINGAALSPQTVTLAHLLVGEAAASMGQHRTAATHLPVAIAATRNGSIVAPLSELLRLQAISTAGLCEFDEAVALAEQATQAARVGSDKVASLVLEGGIHLTMGDVATASARLAAAGGVPGGVPGGDSEQAPIDHLTGRLLAARGDLGPAATSLRMAQTRYERAGQLDAATRVMVDLAGVEERSGDRGRAQALMQDAVAHVNKHQEDRSARAIVLIMAAGVEAGAGNVGAAEKQLEAGQQVAATIDLPGATAYAPWALARIALARNDGSGASAAFAEAEREAIRLGMGLWRDTVVRERTEAMGPAAADAS